MTVELCLDQQASQRQLTNVADRVLSSKRIVFVSGAGISCSAGIPDFRSLHGLYETSLAQNVKGQDLFDISVFKNAETTSLFYKFMAGLRNSTITAQPTPTHRLLKTLKEHGSLVRAYTQNIDGLESRVGLEMQPGPLKDNNVLQLHGDIHTLRCSLCYAKFSWSTYYTNKLRNGESVECPTCADKCAIRVALGRRGIASGTLRPDIVLYGEQHPSGDLIAKACETDLKRKPDCLIVAGTSLKIPGLKRLIKDFATSVHASGGIVLFVNLTEVASKEWSNIFDYHILGTSDGFVDLLRNTRPSFFTKQTTLKSCKATKLIVKSKEKSKIALTSLGNRTKDNIQPSSCHNFDDLKPKISKLVIWNNKENIDPKKRNRQSFEYSNPGTKKRQKVQDIKVES